MTTGDWRWPHPVTSSSWSAIMHTFTAEGVYCRLLSYRKMSIFIYVSLHVISVDSHIYSLQAKKVEPNIFPHFRSYRVAIQDLAWMKIAARALKSTRSINCLFTSSKSIRGRGQIASISSIPGFYLWPINQFSRLFQVHKYCTHMSTCPPAITHTQPMLG